MVLCYRASLLCPPVMCEMLECVSRSPGTTGNDQVLIKTPSTLYQSLPAHWGSARAESNSCFGGKKGEKMFD